MNLPPTMNPADSLPGQLARLGLPATARALDDLLARAATQRWSPRVLLEAVAGLEIEDRARRSLERRLRLARLGRFKPVADFDWAWPKKIDRPLLERALTLDFLAEGRNLILIGANGLGKTLLAKNIAAAAVAAGHAVLFRSAADLLADLAVDSPQLRRRKFAFYARPRLLCIDEVGYLAYDANAADLLYEVVNRRYESRSILITTNRAFKDWSAVFPNAASINTILDRLLHHADVTLIEGQSYRVRDSEREAAARRQS